MGKLYILGDLHFGCRKSSPLFLDYLISSLNTFISRLWRNDKVIILGDVFDHRNTVDFTVLNKAIDLFYLMSEKCNSIDIIAGNHDLYYKNCDANVNYRFLSYISDNINIVHDIQTVQYDGIDILLCSWIDTVEKKTEFLDKIKGHEIICGHFDCGDLYNVKHDEITYLKSSEVKDKLVFSGHYHQNKKIDNIQFVGSFISSTFSDVDSKKGYYELDASKISVTNEIDIKFVKNDCPSFEYMSIDNAGEFLVSMMNLNMETKELLRKKIEGNYIRIFLNEYDTNNVGVCKLIKSYNPKDLSVVYKRPEIEIKESNFEGFHKKDGDFKEVLHHYIKENIDENVNPDKILNIVDHYHRKFSETI